MSTFRTLRPLLVDATQCEHPETIATHTGFRSVSKGDWIVKARTAKLMWSTMLSSSVPLHPVDFLLEAEDGRRPPLRLLICAKGGNPGA
jgi:hypothetical protein